MKRFFITFLLASFTMLFVNAQSKHTVYVWVDGEKTTIENVDSLTFIEEVAPQYVDLGLSVKWATCNLGAATPEEIGNYYAWGETTPKDTYFKNNYKYHDGTEYTKYTEDMDRERRLRRIHRDEHHQRQLYLHAGSRRLL